MIPIELLGKYSRLSKQLMKNPADEQIKEEFHITELQLRSYHLIDKLRQNYAVEILNELNIINRKIDCYDDRQKSRSKKRLNVVEYEF